MKKISGFFVMSAFGFLVSSLAAQDLGVIHSLSMGSGARALGLGSAYIGVADDANAVFWNPAGMSFMNGSVQASASFVPYVADTSFSFINCAFKIGENHRLGLAAGNFMSASLPRLVADAGSADGYRVDGKFNAQDYYFSAAYSLLLGKNLSLGVAAKYVFMSIDRTTSAFAMGFDASAFFRLQPLNIGLVMRNAGMKLKLDKQENSLPLTCGLGLSKTFHLKNERIMVAGDGTYNLTEKTVNYGVGIEYVAGFIESVRANEITLRAGFQDPVPGLGILSGFRAGAGFSLSSFRIDYAFMTLDDLGLCHAFSLSFKT